MLIHWKETFTIDGSVIDDDHRFLIMQINPIDRRLRERLPISFLLKRIEELWIFATLHFEREERLQKRSGYPDLPAHHKEHEDLLVRLDEFVRGLRAQPEDAVVDEPDALRAFCFGWILGHIIHSDQKLKPFLSALDNAGETPLGKLSRTARASGWTEPLWAVA